MWIYVLCIIVIIICLYGFWRKKQSIKKDVQLEQHNSYVEYVDLTNKEIRYASKSDKPDQKILLVLKPDETKLQYYLKPDLTLTNEPGMDNIFYVHDDNPFLLYNYYRGLKEYKNMTDSELKKLLTKKRIFIDADSMNGSTKCYEFVNNNNVTFSLRYINDDKDGFMMLYLKNGKIISIPQNITSNDEKLAEFIIIKVDDNE
jgi:hypothetical protein